MLCLTQQQIDRMGSAATAQFAVRLDAYLQESVGERWLALSPSLRLEKLKLSAEAGLRLGIASEALLAQFALLHTFGGAQLLARPEAVQILASQLLDWPLKLFQLSALANIDMAVQTAEEL